ncbi:bll1948 [Bradyrhizobium diazoefficiens USDA 110]|jgi:hypothetical protein|uniref:Bll1948 protein n=1 Tax=Bradyrhizobium diazoefficiens (strain JCM 10833 / BCRC 13528 / IAM 13628 / NBRC 14792 / USDA 110) TaxID=224911 RepID=Q89TJ2_BRADU|nr:hypothetical protein AAV28_06625 [Bradyrhizobium diazoefficiens USDA 110]APO50588.1 hypothetical protein BD122_10055 [Bradyrhizobium diazoefficiens]KOY05273.1 hypothetical protein AF336_37530 [Bradyrhizobium diazoefficiens]PDT56165.1 hypothetical protein CO678_39945 [Bradyrhizobium diazoefficiens]QBP20800.1 hypothetical protein Bdiaspc4_09900 [Bradyrhizobium diazoefficiens]
MSDNSNLENRTIEAIRHYRGALAVVDGLERKERSAHRALTRTLLELGRALCSEDPRSLKDSIEIGLVAVSRRDESWANLSEATAPLDSARSTLAALECQLRYIPNVSKARDSD